MTKVIIAGSRTFRDYPKLEKECDNILYEYFLNETEIEIVSGAQVSTDPITKEKYGADYLGEMYAKKTELGLKRFPANWYKYGKSGGPRRNREMAAYVAPDGILIAFWDESSSGTRNIIDEVNKLNLKVHIVKI